MCSNLGADAQVFHRKYLSIGYARELSTVELQNQVYPLNAKRWKKITR